MATRASSPAIWRWWPTRRFIPSTAGSRHGADSGNLRPSSPAMRADRSMQSLRDHVQRLGGIVQASFSLVRALSVTVPTRALAELDARDDVVSISPNRTTRQTTSLLESATGAVSARVPVATGTTIYTGLDGSGIGIAVLDSGVMAGNKHMANGLGTRPCLTTLASRPRRPSSMCGFWSLMAPAMWPTCWRGWIGFSTTPGNSTSASSTSACRPVQPAVGKSTALAQGARVMVASGLVVVAAAGKNGQATGKTTFGTIGSPGHDP